MVPVTVSDEWGAGFRRCADVILAIGVPLLLVAAPLWYGSAGAAAAGVVFAACLLLGFVLAARVLSAPDDFQREWRLHSRRHKAFGTGFLFAGLILGYALLTLVPLPPFLLEWLSPAAAGLRRQVFATGWAPASLAPAQTENAVLRLAAVTAFFFVCLAAAPAWRNTVRWVEWLLATIAAVSLAGLLQWLTAGRLLWGPGLPAAATSFGPFVNRNHFASWAGAGVMLGTGYLLSLRHRRRRGTAVAAGNRWPYLLGWTAVAAGSTAVIASLSRGGILALLAGLCGMILLLGARGRLERRWVVPGLLLGLLAAEVWVYADLLPERLGTILTMTPNLRARVDLDQDLLAMAGSFRWLGSGPGTFGEVYPAFQTADPDNHYTYAHNDWLQLWVEWGVVGTLLWLTFLAFFWWKFLRLWWRRHDREAFFVSAGAASGVVLLLAHAVADFALRIPAVGLAAAFLAALALRASGAVTDPRAEAPDGGERAAEGHGPPVVWYHGLPARNAGGGAGGPGETTNEAREAG